MPSHDFISYWADISHNITMVAMIGKVEEQRFGLLEDARDLHVAHSGCATKKHTTFVAIHNSF
jgi:hypothetical protein